VVNETEESLMIKQLLMRLLKIILLLPVLLLAFHTLVRIVRRFVKFPIPQFLTNFIDNPCAAGSNHLMRPPRCGGTASSRE
jgi:hypothetical protein